MGRPAPLQVVEDNGVLRPAMPGDHLDPDGSLLAHQGWDALRDYLADLADQRDRIGNAMPRLSKALGRFETAMGADFDAMNPIAAGTHGYRIIRLSQRAPEILMDEDADDIIEFAAALALFLERFEEWRSYRDAALTSPPSPESIEATLTETREITSDLLDDDAFDPAIAAELTDQADSLEEDKEDSIVATGLIASLSNWAGTVLTKAMPVLKWIRQEAGEITSDTWSGLKKVIVNAAVTGITTLGIAATSYLLGITTSLRNLATASPEKLDWLLKILNALGL